jgi:hypothetical protein
MVERRAEVVARLKLLEEAAAPLVNFLQNPSAVQELKADKQYNLQMLNERYQVFILKNWILFFWVLINLFGGFVYVVLP